MKYTNKQIEECKQYLGFSVKEGYMSEEMAEELEAKKDWQEVEDMMDRGDVYANDRENWC